MKNTKNKTAKQLAAGAYGRGLRNWITRKNLEAMETRREKEQARGAR